MKDNKIIEPVGFIVAAVSGLICLIMFYSNSNMFFGSLFGAIMTAGLVWIAYVVTRMLVLTFR